MELLNRLIGLLCAERNLPPPAGLTPAEQADRFRAMCNVRPPGPVSEEFLRLQDEYLTRKTQERGVVSVRSLAFADGIALWRGDITRLDADAVVNACNADLLGCFQPLHNCIDNVIHSNAGVQVRRDCARMMRGGREKNGRARATLAYNLPSKYILHTVGPIVSGNVTEQNRRDLASCYRSCLELAGEMKLKSVAFCCISTGVYRFPAEQACEIAVREVRSYLEKHGQCLQVIFDVFSEEDERLYGRALRGPCPAGAGLA